MDRKISLDQKFAGWTCVQFSLFLFILVMGISLTDGKVCIKRAEIGDREGNQYSCEDPIRTECCERKSTFTCCEPTWKEAMNDQLWLLLAVMVIGFLLCILVSWCTSQVEFFSSPTAKDAVRNWRDKFANRFSMFQSGAKTEKVGTTLCSKPGYIPFKYSSQSLENHYDLV